MRPSTCEVENTHNSFKTYDTRNIPDGLSYMGNPILLSHFVNSLYILINQLTCNSGFDGENISIKSQINRSKFNCFMSNINQIYPPRI